MVIICKVFANYFQGFFAAIASYPFGRKAPHHCTMKTMQTKLIDMIDLERKEPPTINDTVDPGILTILYDVRELMCNKDGKLTWLQIVWNVLKIASKIISLMMTLGLVGKVGGSPVSID